MKVKNNIKDNFFNIFILILIISISINIYQFMLNKKYYYELGKQNYNKIEEIRFRNESILSILDSCVSAKSVNNMDLLNLYKNYSKISEVELSLWDSYISESNNIFKNFKNNNKNIIINTRTKSELYYEIQELIYSYIKNDMTEKVDAIELEDKIYNDFNTLRNLSLDLNNYFNTFYKENCNVSEIDKEKVMINERYWIDILQDIQELNNKYVDYEFIY